jgi:hypothetical protein
MLVFESICGLELVGRRAGARKVRFCYWFCYRFSKNPSHVRGRAGILSFVTAFVTRLDEHFEDPASV